MLLEDSFLPTVLGSLFSIRDKVPQSGSKAGKIFGGSKAHAQLDSL